MSEFELFLALVILTLLAYQVNLKTRANMAVQVFSYFVLLLAFANAAGLVFSSVVSRLL